MVEGGGFYPHLDHVRSVSVEKREDECGDDGERDQVRPPRFAVGSCPLDRQDFRHAATL
jgi:hypothetical protein